MLAAKDNFFKPIIIIIIDSNVRETEREIVIIKKLYVQQQIAA